MRPENEEQLADAIRAANGPLAIRGGATRGISVEGEALDTAGLTGIRLYEPGALTMVAGAGTPMADIETALAEAGQMLPFEPYDLAGITGAAGQSTIGGVFATNASGPRRVQVGAARDFLLGVRFVDGSGEVIKNGGRVMKNVTGYDLVKLMAGSYGTLGVLSEVSFKVLPRPERVGTLSATIGTIDDAVATMTTATSSPYDVSGAWYDPRQGVVTIRVEGFDGSVAYRLDRLGSLLARFGSWDVGQDDGAAGQLDFLEGSDGDIWRISCRPTDAPSLAARLGEMARRYDWAGGRIWVVAPAGTDLRAQLGEYAGHATVIRGTAHPRFEPEPGGVAHLSAGLRKKFDPRGILNPGLMG